MTIAPPNNQPQPNGNGQILPGLPGGEQPNENKTSKDAPDFDKMSLYELYHWHLKKMEEDSNGIITVTPEKGLKIQLSSPIETHQGKTSHIILNPPNGDQLFKYSPLRNIDGSSHSDNVLGLLCDISGIDEIVIKKVNAMDFRLLTAATSVLSGEVAFPKN